MTTECNAFTSRWSAAVATRGDFVIAGASTWPLLAVLAAASDGPAREELGAALGIDSASAHERGLALIDLLANSKSTCAALGFWASPNLSLRAAWTASVPAGSVNVLRDQRALDVWAKERTRGLIDAFPIALTPDSIMVLAMALAIKTTWVEPFQDQGGMLSRQSVDVDQLSVLDGAVTRLVVRGNDDVDVHLLMGELGPADVLSTGIAPRQIVTASELPPNAKGAGLVSSRVANVDARDFIFAEVPAFVVRSDHDLRERASSFGLTSAMDPKRGHFPGISEMPLFVEQAKSSVLAQFSATGFDAAAITAVSMGLGSGAPKLRHRVRQFHVRFDGPFGFLAVHRASGLVLVAGWLARERPPVAPNPSWLSSALARFRR
jgi:serine protease inhibitor